MTNLSYTLDFFNCLLLFLIDLFSLWFMSSSRIVIPIPAIQICHHSPLKENRGEREKEMAELETSKLSEAFSMNGGDGPNSYAKNSTLQVNILYREFRCNLVI